MRHDAVRQMELAGAALARLAPRCLELPVGGKTMHPRIAVAVGYIQIPVGRRHDFGRIVERAGGTRADFARYFASGVGMDAALPNHLQRLAVQRVNDADRIGAVGQIHDVVLDVDAMRFVNGAQPPGTEIVAAGAENQHRRVFALEHIDAILRIGGHRRGVAHRHPFGQMRPVFLQGVSVFAGTYGHHSGPPWGVE